METLKESLDNLIRTLEAEIPCNPGSKANIKLAAPLADNLATYFQSLLDALPWDKIDVLYNANVQESFREVLASPFNIDIGDWFDPVLQTFQGQLAAYLQQHAVTVYLTGAAEMTSWGRTKLRNLPILFEGPPMGEAINYASAHAAQLVTGIDAATKDQLAQIIADGIQNKRGIDGLARDIRAAFDDMRVQRSKLIAHTETGNALGKAFIDRSVAMGVTGKEWILGSGGREGNCEDCIANADAGVIPIDQEFPSGVMTVLQHPGCTCGCAPVMIKQGEE